MTHWWLNNTLVKQPIHDYSARPTYVLTISVTGQLKPKLMAHSWHQPIHDICILTIPVTGRLKPKLMTHSWLVTMCMWPNCRLLTTDLKTKNNDTVPTPTKKMENRNMIVDTWRLPRAAHASSQNNNVRVISSSLILPPSIRYYNGIYPRETALNQIIIFIPGQCSTKKTEIAKKEYSYSEFYKEKKVL